MKAKVITSPRIAAPVGPFSPGVQSHDLLFLSGQVAQDPATGKLVAGDVTVQAQQVLNNVEALLEAAGKSLADVVKVTVYLTDMTHFAAMNAVYGQRFSSPYPARTTVAVAALPIGAIIEMEVVAQ